MVVSIRDAPWSHATPGDALLVTVNARDPSRTASLRATLRARPRSRGWLLLYRVAGACLIWIFASFVVFALMRIVPGDPVRLMVSLQTPDSVVQGLRDELGLNDPILVQYKNYVVGLLHGDLGTSFRQSVPVFDQVMVVFPKTFYLVTTAIGMTLAVAVPIGLISGLRPYRKFDRGSLAAVIVLQALPGFWIGTMLIYLVSVRWHFLPGFAWVGPKSLVLPAIALAATFIPILARSIRHAVIEVMEQEFVKNLRARGIPQWRIVTHHLSRHLGVPLVTLLGAQVGLMLGAVFIIEYIFNYPGLGKFGVDSVLTRDLPATQGVVMVIATLVIVTNLLVDLSYYVIDPRLRRADRM